MGRQDPLTSLALGRSPYDDVVEGEGEADPHEPVRQYDEHGRVVNEETKRINKDIIRAHNEVMLVIGVAEPDNPAANNLMAEASRIRQEFENATGRDLLRVGRVLVVAGIWGIHGIRQRILVYKETARLPFMELMTREWRTRSPLQFFCSGMPSFFSAYAVEWASIRSNMIRKSTFLRAIINYTRFHFQLYVAMQRLDLVPGSSWLPHWKFFIPFSSVSPFLAPPPLGSPGARTLTEWVGKLVVNMAPYVAYYLTGCAWDLLSYFVRRELRKRLPHPWASSVLQVQNTIPTNPSRRQSVLESPTLGEADREIRHTQQQQQQQPETETEPEPVVDGEVEGEGEGEGETIHLGTIARQNTFSSRGGDDYATDEEDADVVNAPLISFDVDTSESAEPPAGFWSAELRPNNSDDSRPQQKEAPNYMVNTLTSLPANLASDFLTSAVTHIMLTPVDVLVFRAMARAYSFKFGLPTAGLFDVRMGHGLSLRTVLNLFQVETLKLLISMDIWATISLVSMKFHATEEEWKEYCQEMQREVQAQVEAEMEAEAEAEVEVEVEEQADPPP